MVTETSAAEQEHVEPGALCPTCDHPMNDNWESCNLCGDPLDEVVCPGCGETVPRRWEVCELCGENLLNEPAAENGHNSGGDDGN